MSRFLIDKKSIKRLSVIAFLCFLIILTWLVIFKLNIFSTLEKNHRSIMKYSFSERFHNGLIPFFMRKNWQNLILKDMPLNVIAFIPFGIYLPILFKNHTFSKGILTAFLCSLTFELVQLFTAIGCFDSTDLLTNTLGYLVGFAIYNLFVKKMPVKALNAVNACVALIAVPVCFYAIINTANNIGFYTQLINEYMLAFA